MDYHITTVSEDIYWMKDAPCKGATHLFFAPNKSERSEVRVIREARAIKLCSECPVNRACLDYALQNNEFGIWGGTGEEERHSIIRARAAYIITAATASTTP